MITQVARTAAFQNTSKRSRTVDSQRTNDSITKYQRVYVDTPIPQVGPRPEPKPDIQNLDDKFLEKNNSLRNCFSKPNSLSHLLILPFRLACRCPVWLCSQVWEGILAIDELLESFLRCLFLLDPSKRPTRY